jgi:hypothetical protein
VGEEHATRYVLSKILIAFVFYSLLETLSS